MTSTGTGTGTAPLPKPVGPLGLRHVGRYEIIAKLASGGMATVYLGRLAGAGGFERRVAIKILHPHLAEDEATRASFLDEARLAASIRDPHVVPVIDIGDGDGTGTFLVMEYIEGCDLAALLKAAGRATTHVPTPVALRIVVDLLMGLEAAHDLRDPQGAPLNLVHRDVSPHNLIVGSDGVGRLTDFGIAKAEGRMAQTKTGQLKGKLSYMPPERLRGIREASSESRDSDHRGDLYAAGVVLWETLTGSRLFRGRDDFDVLKKVMDAEVPLPSSRRAGAEPLDAVVMRSIERQPDERFATARAMREAIESVAPKVGGVATPAEVRGFLLEICGARLEEQRQAIDVAIAALEATPTVLAPKKSENRAWRALAVIALLGVAGLSLPYALGGSGDDDVDAVAPASTAPARVSADDDPEPQDSPPEPTAVGSPSIEPVLVLPTPDPDPDQDPDPEVGRTIRMRPRGMRAATSMMGGAVIVEAAMVEATMDPITMDAPDMANPTMGGTMQSGAGDEVIENPYAI